MQRQCSPHTIRSYQTALIQLLDYAKEQKGCKLTAIPFEILDYAMVSGFLENMETTGCSVSTRNHKLKAIRAFFAYAAMMDITTAACYKELEKIPWKKEDSSAGVDFLSEAAVKAMLAQPDGTTRKGLRDRFMLILMYDTGARVQELLDIKICDLRLGAMPTIKLLGKGRKYRLVPIMPKTVQHLEHYLKIFHPNAESYSTAPLFYVERKGVQKPMSDDNVRKLLRRYAQTARLTCPEIPVNMHPHLLRHSRAMHLYQQGMDLTLISQWLGHANLETTLVYAHADTELKRKAIEKANSGICDAIDAAEPGTDMETDEETLKRLYGLR